MAMLRASHVLLVAIANGRQYGNGALIAPMRASTMASSTWSWWTIGRRGR